MNVGVLEARNRLSELIEAAQRGEDITITKRGEPAVKLVAVESAEARKVRALEALKEMGRIADSIRERNGRGSTWEEIKADRDFGRP